MLFHADGNGLVWKLPRCTPETLVCVKGLAVLLKSVEQAAKEILECCMDQGFIRSVHLDIIVVLKQVV